MVFDVVIFVVLTFSLQMYHDNRTTPHKELIRKPLTGFTHTYTPNDFEIIDDEVMEQLGRNMFSKSKNVATPSASKPNFFVTAKVCQFLRYRI